MKKIRWGILGAGRIAHSFAQDMRFATEGEVVAVASRREDTAAVFAKEYAIPHIHTGYDSLLADPDVDVVYIATPHSEHLANATAALKFFTWAYANGDKMADDLDYVPMPDNVIGAIEKAWGDIKDASGKQVAFK